MNTAIRVESLSKRYLIGHRSPEQYLTLRDAVMRTARGIGRRLIHPFLSSSGQPFLGEPDTEELWALKDVSFEVAEGDRFGIIGRNGAGKSTLLKVLSRITEPTGGRALIKGRIASLLEVGTGFHAELTGRENIFLNGSILGMRKEEVKRKFDEIVDFAQVEKFLDTPVKRYSSGMYVRLAFAVAAHLEPEILIVDEVLAVGDARFQKKCLGKMEQVGREGRTVIFVSHNMAAIASLCTHAILLDSGRVVTQGKVGSVIDHYLHDDQTDHQVVDYRRRKTLPGDQQARLLEVRLRRVGKEDANEVSIDDEVCVEMRYRLIEGGKKFVPNLHFYRSDGSCAFVTNEPKSAGKGAEREAGDYLSRCFLPSNFLNDGTYSISFALTSFPGMVVHFNERDALMLRVVDPIEGVATRNEYAGPIPGAVRPSLDWEVKRLP